MKEAAKFKSEKEAFKHFKSKQGIPSEVAQEFMDKYAKPSSFGFPTVSQEKAFSLFYKDSLKHK